MSPIRRRRFLATAATVSLIAGCTTGQGSDEVTPAATDTPPPASRRPAPTANAQAGNGREGDGGGCSTVLTRYRDMLLEIDPDASRAHSLRERQLGDGSWPDIEYDSVTRAGWEPHQHLHRLRVIARAWAHSESESHGDSGLLEAIHGGLEFWAVERPKSDNWWYNEIGAPRTMRDVLVLTEHALSERIKANALDTLDQTRVGRTGANLVWTVEIGVHRACLRGNAAAAAEAVQKLGDAIAIGADAGIQGDFSFFQHGSRLQSYHYGSEYLDLIATLGQQVRGTRMDLSRENKRVISRYILDGLQWMARGTHLAPSVMDRKVSRKNALTSRQLLEAAQIWSKLAGADRSELRQLVHRLRAFTRTGEWPLRGFRHFYDADFSAYHGDGFSFFLKTISSRTEWTGGANAENQQGIPYLTWGDHYLLTGDTHPYAGLQPVWEWDGLPGLTLHQSSPMIDRQDWAGGVGNGTSGGVTMHGVRDDGDRVVGWRKLWFLHNNEIVVLIADWRFEGHGPGREVYTALDQNRLRGPVYAVGDDSIESLSNGTHQVSNLQGVWHNRVTYSPLEPTDARIDNRQFDGSWRSINHRYSDDRVEEPVFHARLIHGETPAPTGYVIRPGISENEVRQSVQRNTFTVLQNDSTIQAIQGPAGVGVAAFHKPSALAVGGETLSVDQPGLVLWDGPDVYISDPRQLGGFA